MAVIEVVKGRSPGQRFELLSSRFVLGRDPEKCDVVLSPSAVSREHAQILQMGDEFYIEDLKSRNGTYVNGQVISGRQRLEDSDEFEICDLVFSFRQEVAPTRKELARTVSLDDDLTGSSTGIMTTLEVSSSSSGLRISVNPEMKLRAMVEIAQSLGKAVSLPDVLQAILDGLFQIFVQADRGFVVLRDAENAQLIVKAVKYRREEMGETTRISRTIVNQVIETKEAVLSADAASDERFDASQSIAEFSIRSMMCAPLLDSEGNAQGVLQIDTIDQKTGFQQSDLDVLASVACQAAVSVENAQLHETALRQKALERDLEVAHQVQQGFLPSCSPDVEGYAFFDFYEPAQMVGGDFFDYIPLPGDRLAVVVADVSGKGIPASLLVARLSAETRYALLSESKPSDAVTRINKAFATSVWEDRFITFILAVIDLSTHEVTIVNSGHMAPYTKRPADGQVETVAEDVSGLPLGVFDEETYEQYAFDMKPGEILTLYTDGISEAMDPNGEIYGLDRLQEIIAKSHAGVVELGSEILDDVKKFVRRHPQSDDMCLLCFGRSKE